MPANLPPQYYELEREFKQESDPSERLRLAKELLALMPKHKGTDKLQAELKAKISKLKKQIDGGDRKHGARHADTHDHMEREGAAQIILIGPPNSGKSSLVDALTHAKPLVGDYPYTTREPLAGMMEYETVQIQLIDTPPISEELFESYMPSLIRQADRVVTVTDVSTPESKSRIDILIALLKEKRIILAPQFPKEVEDPRFAYKRTLFVAHKYLDEGGDKGLLELKEQYPDFVIIPTSILDDDSLLNFKKAIFDSLEVIRVYTKKVGHEPDFVDPIILPIGGTVEDAARSIHKDFAQNLQFAKIWGHGKFEGQRVKNSYVLADKDVIEFHI